MEEAKYSEANKIRKKHPIKRANIVSRMFFCWLIPYFKKGYKRDLTEDDMYGALKAHESSRLGDKLEKAWSYQIKYKKHPSLWRAIIQVFFSDLIKSGIFYLFIELVIQLSQPILISRLLKLYETNEIRTAKNEAIIYAGLYVSSILINAVCLHNYYLQVLHLGMKIRVATCSLIYRKALRLNKSALVETTVGQMVNLLTNDVGRFDFATVNIHSLWIGPIMTIVTLCLVYIYVGLSGLVGICFLLLFFPLQIYMSKLTSKFRLQTAICTDERVRLMNEIISGIQVIKMYTWEKPFAKLVEISRRKEMKKVQLNSVIRAIMMSCNLVMIRTATFFCILTYILTGNTISASYTFTLSFFYSILGREITQTLPFAVMQIAEGNVSVKRIRKFLMYEEMETTRNYITPNKNLDKNGVENGMKDIFNKNDAKKEIGIHISNITVKWTKSATDNTLESVNFQAEANKLIAIVGPVGAGKSTLLHVILNELIPTEGKVEVSGSISYASQEPWLFGGSIRQNIIFGNEFNSKKYREVVKVCALDRDFSLFSYGDQTVVGDRGVKLSGGQKARINLARAIYKDADIYLLDDPLSAVDTTVGKQLFEDCICSYLKSKCVILVTHQLQYLRNVDHIYLLQSGKIEASGSYANLKDSENIFSKLLSYNQDEQEEVNVNVTEDNDIFDSNGDSPDKTKEEKSTGVVSWKVYKSYFYASGGWFKSLILLLVFILSQTLASSVDYFVTIWINLEQWKSQNIVLEMSDKSNNSIYNNASISTVPQENFILIGNNAIIIYSSLISASLIITFTRSIAFYKFCINASTNLHNLMFLKIVHASMWFFNNNSSGRILNRFSKDMGGIDEVLPNTLMDTIQIGLMALAIALVIASLNPWMIIPTVIILIIFYCLKQVFIATSRDIKRVEAVTRSPMYTHLTASLHGLTTIRAFRAQEILKKEFDNYQNHYSAASFLFLGANRTFGFWLDFHCVIYIALIAISTLFIENETYGANVGLALTQALGLCLMFQWGMRQWSELENQMTSVERVQEYIDITPESNDINKLPPRMWPEEGRLSFENLSLRYSLNEPYVLKNLTFEVNPREKVGIVGRTGAGKSSLIAALFRLANTDGKILIDNVNINSISLNSLRSKISIIPQEPVLFSGTLRKNLDPFDEYNDDVLWRSLAEVELKNEISNLPSGLDSKISEGGTNFSVGQRQLFCLARAIIRNNKILVLDEATANIDPYTDALIQSTIRRKFTDCTVLTIAHRLHTIMDSDKILVMDAGIVVEFDQPHKLMQNTSGVFYKLVMQTGKSMAQNLMDIAQENYKVS